MSTLLLHIGMPKVGSTAIQALLSANQDPLAELGWNYPDFCRLANHVELAAFASDHVHPLLHPSVKVTNRDELTEFQARFTEEFSVTSTGNWVFSSEHLASHLSSPEAVERLASLVGHFDTVRIVLYVRRQDEIAAGSHSTWIITGMHAPFDVQTHLDFPNRYDYRLIAQRWMDVFGASAVEVRLYPGRNLLADFATVLGGSLELFEEPAPANVSLTNVELEFLRALNAEIPRWEDGKPKSGTGNFANAISGSGRGQKVRLADADRRLLLEQFRESNEWILDHAANGEGLADHFSPPTGDDPGNLDVELTPEDYVALAARLWKRAANLKGKLGQARQNQRRLRRRLNAMDGGASR